MGFVNNGQKHESNYVFFPSVRLSLSGSVVPKSKQLSLVSVLSMEEGNDLLRYSSSSDLLSTFKKMNTLRANTQLCDVTLMAGERRIRAHRVIMAGFSDYFDAMFNGDLAETIQDVIHIRNVDPDALAAIVDYAYTGKLDICVDNVENMLTVACLLQVETVKQQCCKFMKQHLHSTNCLGIRAFAEGHGCEDLFKAADNFTKENFLQVSSQFLTF